MQALPTPLTNIRSFSQLFFVGRGGTPDPFMSSSWLSLLHTPFLIEREIENNGNLHSTGFHFSILRLCYVLLFLANSG